MKVTIKTKKAKSGGWVAWIDNSWVQEFAFTEQEAREHLIERLHLKNYE